ncbi:MAG: TMEM165/GDT1 family protein, partial [Acidimicrobiales bacterium]
MQAFLVSAGLVFVAELGDKTQLVALGLAARYRVTLVLTGLVLAYALTNLVSVTVGGLLGVALPTTAVGIGGGVLFLAFAWKTYGDRTDDEDERIHVSPRHVVLSVAGAMIVAERGD